MIKRQSFLRYKPDFVSEALVEALSGNAACDFNEIFLLVRERLRERKFGGGEEMLRLRLYEKLQVLVRQGIVNKADKKYKAVAARLKARREEFAAEKAAAALKQAAPPAEKRKGEKRVVLGA